MPLSAFQQSILRLLAQNRSPESYVAGATVLHQIPDSPRFSDDLDMFHDVEDSVARSAEFDVAVLDANGFAIEWILRQPAYLRAIAAKEGQSLRLEWAQDSAFRFFPVEQDELCGYRLHRADAATNKVLALAGRREARDFYRRSALGQQLSLAGGAVLGRLWERSGIHARFLARPVESQRGFYPRGYPAARFGGPPDATGSEAAVVRGHGAGR